jgi:bacillolysin
MPTSGNDYGGVHYNSGVLNYWFYLLSQGGAGTNDKGNAFTVTGIGIDKAARIAYLTEQLLSPTSNFASARAMAVQAVSPRPNAAP